MLWQSFDHPTDTLLPNMKLGLTRIIGLDRFLTSWKSQDDPRIGDYFYKMNPTCGFPQVAMYKGSTLYWLSDPWRWQTRKHGCGWEGAAPKSDTGRGVQHGCLRISAAFELFFFSPRICANLARFTPVWLRFTLIHAEPG